MPCVCIRHALLAFKTKRISRKSNIISSDYFKCKKMLERRRESLFEALMRKLFCFARGPIFYQSLSTAAVPCESNRSQREMETKHNYILRNLQTASITRHEIADIKCFTAVHIGDLFTRADRARVGFFHCPSPTKTCAK